MFDTFHHNYSAFAVGSLKSMFPHRSLVAVVGSSDVSIPDFSIMIGADFKCQLMFIDGKHTPYALNQDLLNFAGLADPDFNIVIIDDLQDPELNEIYVTWKEMEKLNEIEIIDNIRSSGCISWRLSGDGTHYVFDEGDEECLSMFPGVGKIAIASYVN